MNVFNKIASEFSAKRVRPWPEVEKVAGLSPVLDVGAGSGRHSFQLAKQGADVVAIDLSREMLKIVIRESRRRGFQERIQVVCCDAPNLPFRDEVFSGAVCLAAIHHLPSKEERERAMIEVRRVLKRGGLLVASVWARYQGRFLRKVPRMLLSKALGEVREYGDLYVPWKSRGGVFMRFYHLFTKRELKRLADEAGLTVREIYSRSFAAKLLAENHVLVAERTS